MISQRKLNPKYVRKRNSKDKLEINEEEKDQVVENTSKADADPLGRRIKLIRFQ